MDGTLIVCEGPDVLLAYMPRKVTEVHVARLLGDVSCDEKTGVVRVDCACRKLCDIYTKVGEHLIKVIAGRVCRVTFWDNRLKASCDDLLLKGWSLFVEVSTNDEFTAGELRQDIVDRDQKAVNRLAGHLAVLRCQVDA